MVHQYYSDHVASAFVDSLESTCARGSYRYESKATESLAESHSGHTFWGPDVLKAFPVCLRPLTYFSSESYFNQKGLSRSQLTGLQKPNITRGSWMLFEDRKGKPGWISNVSRSSMEIPFNHSGGHKASLTISWAHSYESFGDMRARVYRADSRSDSTGWVVLPGKVSGARVSVPASETWDSDSRDHAGEGLVKQEWLDAEWEIQRFVLEVQAQKLHRAQKVKLLNV